MTLRCRFGGRALRAALAAAAFSAMLSPARADSLAHERYPPIDDPVVKRFLSEGLFRARSLLGAPAVPVRAVHIRRSVPLGPAAGLPANFRRTDLVDPNDGVFVIYVSRAPGEYAFEGQLAHEIAHLLNARLFDVYAEGLCTVFAERYVTEQGFDFAAWRKHLESGAELLYGLSYQMMRDVWGVAGDEEIRRLLAFARDTPGRPGAMHLDFAAWAASLDPAKGRRVVEIVARYAPRLESAAAASEPPLTFLRPAQE